MTVIKSSNFNISPILNTQLNSIDSCECNFPLKNPIFDIVMYHKSLWIFCWYFAQNQDPILFLEISRLLSHLILGFHNRKPDPYWGSICKPCTYQLCTRKRIPQDHIFAIYVICAYFYTHHRMGSQYSCWDVTCMHC